jgi:multiple sugar transport system ATP-binding protein
MVKAVKATQASRKRRLIVESRRPTYLPTPPPEAMAALRLHQISRSFGSTRVLDGVDLDIRDGEFLTLVGPSGCGKTTLLRIIAGLDHAEEGQVEIDGALVDDLPPKQRDVAMVFQSYALYPYMTVAQNLALPLVMRQLSRLQRLPLIGPWWPGARARRREIDIAVEQVAESVGLGQMLHRRPAQLSGGQRQRVALGRAMVRRPKVFLMDEPLSNLDAKLRVDTRAEIADLHRRLGATFVYVTHDQVEAMTMSDRVALMMGGRILQLGTPQEIYDDPLDLRVAEFIGTPKINVLAAEVREQRVHVGGAAWPLSVAAEVGSKIDIAVRPEAWCLNPGTTALSATYGRHDGLVSASVRHLESLGSETLVHVTVPHQAEPMIARVEPSRARALRLTEPVTLAVDAALVLAFDAAGRRIRLQPDIPSEVKKRAGDGLAGHV